MSVAQSQLDMRPATVGHGINARIAPRFRIGPGWERDMAELIFTVGGNGTPIVQVKIVDNLNGSFTFYLDQIGSNGGAWETGDLKGEIRGVFFDVGKNVALANSNLTGI